MPIHTNDSDRFTHKTMDEYGELTGINEQWKVGVNPNVE